VLPQIIYACHYGIFKQGSHAIARKPCDATAVLFGLKFADDIHYKFKSSQASKARLQSRGGLGPLAALAYMEEAAHFWECPRVLIPDCGRGFGIREIFGK